FCCGPVIHLLGRLAIQGACSSEYVYHDVPCHWLQVKCLKFLQLFPPPGDESALSKLNDVLKKVLTNTDVSEKVNKSNADHSILFEAVNLIIVYGAEGSDPGLRSKAMTLLGRFIAVREPNIRYLGLEAMGRLARLEGAEAVRGHQKTVMLSLKDADLSMQVGSTKNVVVGVVGVAFVIFVVVSKMWLFSCKAISPRPGSLKIAILAEAYAGGRRWYRDTGGMRVCLCVCVGGAITAATCIGRCRRVLNEDLQEYAAEAVFGALRGGRAGAVHAQLVAAGGYLLGEFGFLVAEKQPGMSGEEQLQVLQQHFEVLEPSASGTKALLLSTYAKLANLYEECRPAADAAFRRLRRSTDLELQQRAAEYLGLPQQGPEARTHPPPPNLRPPLPAPRQVVEDVLREMPPFPEGRASALEERLRRQERKKVPGGRAG
ncbi:unnamed protein product, partial [Heterosigma akashiwo]